MSISLTYTRTGFPVFSVPRKVVRWLQLRNLRQTIRDHPEPMKCITVQACVVHSMAWDTCNMTVSMNIGSETLTLEAVKYSYVEDLREKYSVLLTELIKRRNHLRERQKEREREMFFLRW